MSLVMTTSFFSNYTFLVVTITPMLYLAITLLLIDLYEGVIYNIGNFKAVKYNYVYFKYDFEHLS